MELCDRAVIATLSTGAWRAQRLHRPETQAENERHGLTDRARVTVRLTTHEALTQLTKLHAAARVEHYRLTLPGAEDGLRILPGARELEHAEAMRGYRTRHESLAAQVIADYPTLRAEAPGDLNGLFDARHWPENIADLFTFRTRYLPVPQGGQWDEWLAEAMEEGRAELRDRIATAVRHVAEKLRDPKGVFRDSLIKNLVGILDLAGDLNLAGDPEIARLTAEARDLTAHRPARLREDTLTRQDTADRAEEICQAFSL